MSLIKLNNNFYYEIRPILKEKISVRGAPDFMEFFNSLDKQSDRYKEINEALDLLKKDYAKGDKIPRDRLATISQVNWPQFCQIFPIFTAID